MLTLLYLRVLAFMPFCDILFHYRKQKNAYRKLILEAMTVAAAPLTELCFRFLGVAVRISVLLAAHRPLL